MSGDRVVTTPPAIGSRTFGMYELLARIAVGGMAEIWLAREAHADAAHGPTVRQADELLVVKRILAPFARDRRLLAMFLDEQRVAATLRHDNIVRTYDVGEVDGEYFISMEYLRGDDVRRMFREVRRRGETFPLDVALAIVSAAAAGLDYAHDKTGVDMAPLDIVHRDVSPHNLITTHDGRVVVVDFGVAKARSRRRETAGGTVKGKVPYMAPEQCQGLRVDRRTDIYALGVILYELTTTSRMYSSSYSDFEIMRRIVERAPAPPSERVPGYPPRLEAIALRALAKDPARRFQTARELGAALEAFARARGLEIADRGAASPARERVAAFHRALFADELQAWREVSGDATALARHLSERERYRETDPLPEDDFIIDLSADAIASRPGDARARSPRPDELSDHSGARADASGASGSGVHLSRAFAGARPRVWGAAHRTGDARASQTRHDPDHQTPDDQTPDEDANATAPVRLIPRRFDLPLAVIGVALVALAIVAAFLLGASRLASC